jgi:hypothetical protein
VGSSFCAPAAVGNPYRYATLLRRQPQHAATARTRQATDVFWKGSSSKGYVLAGVPVNRGSIKVPAGSQHSLHVTQDASGVC